LNPSDFFLPSNPDIIIFGYCLAENKSNADDVVVWSQTKKKSNLKLTPDKYLLPAFERKSTKIKKTLHDGFDDDEENSMDERNDKDLYSTDAITFSRICHITTEPIDKASVTLESIENMLIARGHIIICGISHNFIDFIKPLRAKHLPKSECPAIVILCKEMPDEKLWSTIAFFDQIYLIHGDPMNKSDLKRAGIRYAKKVVILAPSIHEISQFTYTKRKNMSMTSEDYSKQTTARKLTREEEDLLDSKTIFKYNMISKMKKDIFIIVELISPKNVAFLYNKGRQQNDEYKFIKANMNIDGTAAFASGEVYFSSIMDNLVTQAYYNPSLLSVLKKLILGEDQSIYKKTSLNKYKDIISANLYLIDIPSDPKNDTDNNNTTTRNLLLDDPNFKMTFMDVFQVLLKRKIIVIGVYRADNSNGQSTYSKPFGKLGSNLVGISHSFINFDKNPISSNFYYVVTSPEPSFKLNSRDKLFVLSQTYPNDELFQDGKVEKVTKIDDDILKQYESNQFKSIKKNEEKKDNPRVFDHVGEIKIKEVNISLKETIDSLKNLKINITKIKDKVEKTICESVYHKLSNLNNNVNSKSDSNSNSNSDEMSNS
jgi:hypothetical protein